MLQISVDLLLIGRCLLAFFWGIIWAIFIQYHRMGQFWAEERTWLTVVIGVGVDMLIAYGSDWWTVLFVISASSVGIIGRSLINERDRTKVPSGYKTLWRMEDSIAILNDVIDEFTVLVQGREGDQVAQHSKILREIHRASRLLQAARRGEYEGHK